MYAFFGNMSRHILEQLEMDVHACPCLCMYATLCFESVLEQLRQFLLVSVCVCIVLECFVAYRVMLIDITKHNEIMIDYL